MKRIIIFFLSFYLFPIKANLSYIVLDMKKLSRIDETALEKLSSYNKSLKNKGATLEIINQNENVKKRFNKFFGVI